MVDGRSWEAGIGVWAIQCGSIRYKIAAASAGEATGWFEQRTGLASFEYGDVAQVEDLHSLMVFDIDQPLGTDQRCRHHFGQITAREAIRRTKEFPAEI